MTLNRKVALTGVICIFLAGFLGSFKSFKLHEDYKNKVHQVKSEEISQWVAETVEQKITQLESSVSYLDKSTVETLKRLGTRYFVYAFKKDGEWSLKWKVLGEFGKEKILSEVNQIDFDQLSSKERSWTFSEDQRLIYIAPVKLSQSHQLKSGFLIFGLQKDFFSFLDKVDKSLVLVTKNSQNIHRTVPAAIAANSEFFNTKEAVTSMTLKGPEEQAIVYAGYFSSLAQLWIVNQQSYSASAFMGSSFFMFFLLACLLAALVLLALMSQMGPMSSKEIDLKAAPTNRSFNFNIPEFSSWIPSFGRKTTLSSSGEDSDLNQMEMKEVEDFAAFLDTVLEPERQRLAKVDVQLNTLVEEGARVLCSPSHVADLIKRLIGNSVLALEGEEQKEIQIQLVEQKKTFQLIYVDSRTDYFPSGEKPSLLLQTEGSLSGIDGIIAYASWLFGEGLTVAKKGFCLSVDLNKVDAQAEKSSDQVTEMEVTPLTETLDRIEIDEPEDEEDIFANFTSVDENNGLSLEKEEIKKLLASTDEGEGEFLTPVDLTKDEDSKEETTPNYEDFITNFKLKEFEFKHDDSEANDSDEVEAEVRDVEEPQVLADQKDQTANDKGLFEFNSGQFKIKIRSPKKRDMDVDNRDL